MRSNACTLRGGFKNSRLIFDTDTAINHSGTDSLDVFLTCFDSLGNNKWVRSAGGTGSDQGFSISLDQRGHLWTVGNLDYGFYTAGYTAAFGSLSLTEAGGSAGWDPLYIACYDTTGTALSVSSITGGGDDMCTILVDNKGSFYLSGDWLSATQAFGPDTLRRDSIFGEKAFVAKYRYDSTFYTLHAIPPNEAPVTAIELFPNPVNGNLTVVAREITALSIIDLTGRKMYEAAYNCTKVDVDVSGLPPGMYFIWINHADVRKFIKR